jgi:hypothetical protein
MPTLIHISRNGQQEGPFNINQIQQMLSDGNIARYTLAWKDGLSEWVPLSEVLDSLPPEVPDVKPTPPAPTAPAINIKHKGIGRPAYVGSLIGISILAAFLLPAEPESSDGDMVIFLTSALLLIPVAFRLQNIGKNVWWTILIFIPLANIYIGALCLFAPAGYQQTKKLDTFAKILLSLIIGSIALAILAVIFETLS